MGLEGSFSVIWAIHAISAQSGTGGRWKYWHPFVLLHWFLLFLLRSTLAGTISIQTSPRHNQDGILWSILSVCRSLLQSACVPFLSIPLVKKTLSSYPQISSGKRDKGMVWVILWSTNNVPVCFAGEERWVHFYFHDFGSTLCGVVCKGNQTLPASRPVFMHSHIQTKSVGMCTCGNAYARICTHAR